MRGSCLPALPAPAVGLTISLVFTALCPSEPFFRHADTREVRPKVQGDRRREQHVRHKKQGFSGRPERAMGLTASGVELSSEPVRGRQRRNPG